MLEQIFYDDVGTFCTESDDAFFKSLYSALDGLAKNRKYYVATFRVFEFRAFLYRFFEENVSLWFSPKQGVSLQQEESLFMVRLVAYGWTAFICEWGREGFEETPEELLRLFKTAPSYPLWNSK